MSGEKIVIVDDSRATTYLLSEGLKKEGVQTFQANSGSDGIHLIIKNQPDLVILDLAMPDVNGYEVLES